MICLHVLVWLAADSPRLSNAARELLVDPDNHILMTADERIARSSGPILKIQVRLTRYGFTLSSPSLPISGDILSRLARH